MEADIKTAHALASWESCLSVARPYQFEPSPNPTPDVGLIQKWTTAVRGRCPPIPSIPAFYE